MLWNDHFLTLFDRCLAEYQSGNREFTSYYSPEDLSFLASIGYKPRELFDFIEDLADEGQPSRSTALLIAAARRDYFLVEQNSQPSSLEITSADLPTFGDTLGNLPYLPRIITKARAKLRGELDPDIMFGCGGDRKFLREHGNIPPADFLRHVWAAGENDDAILAYVQSAS
ncbi:MAG: DUF5069 domain-containing protein [Verrucomicrobiota bacterium]